jgi:two-component system, NtrC family, C4-dicarboxylate transport response regulator DctD
MINPTSMPVTIVDDEPEVRAALRQLLELEGLSPFEFSDSETALATIDAQFAGVVIADLRMPGLDGIGLFNRLSRLDPELPVIMISGHGDISTAVDLVRRGAYDFLSKPFDAEQLLATVRRALDKRALALENRAMRQSQPPTSAHALLGESREIEQLRQTINQLVQADIDVLVSGESGVGKSQVASILHRRSPRARKAMITLDCRALPGEQAESLLFGHVSGAFPGAQFPRTGQLLLADAGTLLLDHVDGMPVFLQTRLQQVLEQGAIIPVGGNVSQSTRFRSLSTTSQGIAEIARGGGFLPSLYFRLSGYTLAIPPLRDRGDDTVVLFRAFLCEEANRLGRETPRLTPNVWRRLKDHDWPGNVRELQSFAANVAVGLDETVVLSPAMPAGGSLKLAVGQFESDAIRAALERKKGDIAATIADLDLPRKTFYDKLARHRIDPSEYRKGR